jgi:hypothetical protein
VLPAVSYLRESYVVNHLVGVSENVKCMGYRI